MLQIYEVNLRFKKPITILIVIGFNFHETLMDFDNLLVKLTAIFVQKGFDQKQSEGYATDLIQQATLRFFSHALEAKIPEIESLDPASSPDEMRAQLWTFHQPQIEQLFLKALQETLDEYVTGLQK